MKKSKAYETYQGAVDAERHREKQWRRTKQGAFESSFVSFEETSEGYYPLAAVVRRAYMRDGPSARRAYKTAHEHVRRKAPHCLRVFELIIRNGSNRRKSICEMISDLKSGKRVLASARQSNAKHRSGSIACTAKNS